MTITEKCKRCGKCVENCPVAAIKLAKGDTQARIDKSICIECGYCKSICPFKAIEDK